MLPAGGTGCHTRLADEGPRPRLCQMHRRGRGNLSAGGYTGRSLRRMMASEEGKEVRTMDGILLMAGTIVVEGGLVYGLLWLFTQDARDAQREEDARSRLKALEAEEELLRKAA